MRQGGRFLQVVGLYNNKAPQYLPYFNERPIGYHTSRFQHLTFQGQANAPLL